MQRICTSIMLVCMATISFCSTGADMPWTTFEAEQMKTNAQVLGSKYAPHLVETESSHQQCVQLDDAADFIEWTATSDANAMVIRYSLPDAPEGSGTEAELLLLQNDKQVKSIPINSRYSHLYGDYPFSNDPAKGKHRNFYDEIRIKDLSIEKKDVLRLQVKNKTGEYCIIDLVDLEKIALKQQPKNSLSITDSRFADNDVDYTDALRKCIEAAVAEEKSVWLPAGTFQITGDIEVPSGLTIQGAGMWHTTLLGDKTQYTKSDKRVRIMGSGSNIHLADFAIIGKLNYRSDREPNDGIVGSYGENSTISRIWVEHTKVGVWVDNCKNLLVQDCRFRDTIADGVNFCVGVTGSTMQNCTARGTGDDCFAIWPATHGKQEYTPGFNTIRNCTGQLPFLANGAAVYGAESNKVLDCKFTDITPGCAILISTTFPTSSDRRNVDNNFKGTTVVKNCDITRSGGWDHVWQWRAAVQICLDRRSISGVEISKLNITDSISDAISIIAPGSQNDQGTLSNTVFSKISVSGLGLGAETGHGLWIRNDVVGGLTIRESDFVSILNDLKNFIIE